jgi:hypothetical protein
MLPGKPSFSPAYPQKEFFHIAKKIPDNFPKEFLRGP